MKVAVFLYGEYRQFEQAVKLYSKQLADLSPDYYVATWEHSLEQDFYKTYYVKHTVTEGQIKAFLPDARISIDNDINKRFDMTRKIYTLLNNCCSLYEKSNVRYDVIIVKRLDTIDFFGSSREVLPSEILKIYDYHSIYTRSGLSDSKSFDFGDLFYYGSPSNIVRFIRAIYSRIVDVESFRGKVHEDPDKFLFYSDFSVKKIPVSMDSIVIRPTPEFIKITEEANEINSELYQNLLPAHSDWYKYHKYAIIRD